MIIDWHAHLITPEQAAEPFWRGNCPMAIEPFMASHHEAKIDISVISDGGRCLKSNDLKTIQRWGDYAASLQDEYPGVLYGLATADPCGGKLQLRETERAIRELGLKGFFIYSSHNGHYPDDDEATGFWEMVQALDVPVMIHPSVGEGENNFKGYRLANSVGRPHDTTLALARLIVRGTLEQFPNLKIIGSHLGGGICEVIGRMDYAYELQDEAHDFMGPYGPVSIKHPPSHYLSKLYLDTVSYHPPAIRCAIETVGVDHVLHGSDGPPLRTLKKRAIGVVNSLNLSSDDSEKVFWRNAASLLKLEPGLGSPGA